MRRVWTLTAIVAVGTAFFLVLVVFGMLLLNAGLSFLVARGITLDEDFCFVGPHVPANTVHMRADRRDDFPWIGWKCTYELKDGTHVTFPR